MAMNRSNGLFWHAAALGRGIQGILLALRVDIGMSYGEMPLNTRAVLIGILNWAFLVVVAGSVRAQSTNESTAPCNQPGSTADTANCFDEALHTADNKLNRTYERVRQVLKSRPEDLARLVKAERSWIAYRDLTCEGEYGLYGGGTGGPPARIACLRAETLSREASLRRSYGWLVEKFGE